jgi:CRISPR/Cas system-associated protein Csm6
MFETFSNFDDNFNGLSELQKEVYHEILRRYGDDMSH